MPTARNKAETFERGLLDLVFLNTALANIGDSSGLQPSATAGSLYISLHTADPTDSGDQTSSETSYTGYARVAVARSGSGWTRSSSQITNAAAVVFGTNTGSQVVLTHLSVGTDSAGAGTLLYVIELSSSLTIPTGDTPRFIAGEIRISED